MKNNNIKKLVGSVSIIIGTLLVALLLNSFVIQAYEVDGMSMEPTLKSGDRLVIWKLKSTIGKHSSIGYVPKRGDIVVISHTAGLEKISYIKRVIGLPGERVKVSAGKMTIYNSRYPGGLDPDDITDYGKYLESTFGELEIKVGKNSIFVVGDNRLKGGSIDSRSDLGLVDLKSIEGKLSLRLYPINKIKRF